MTITWILVADQSRARLFEFRPGQSLAEIQGFANPGGRAGEDEPQDAFARSLDRFLAKARSEHGFDRLCVVAPQRFLGRLRAHMAPAVARVPGEDIPHEVAAWNAQELEPWLRQRGVRF